jgi:hypothetical protein
MLVMLSRISGDEKSLTFSKNGSNAVCAAKISLQVGTATLAWRVKG